MVDIHSHILPGLDDGARNLDDALAMVKMAAQAGTTDIVATPHANWEFTFRPHVVREKIDQLQQACGDILRIHYGCDFHLSIENVQDALLDPHRYTINGKDYLLVEFSDLHVPESITEIFERLLAGGIVPIITHPERNPILQKKTAGLKSWVDLGCLIQVTGQSFLGRFGTRAGAAARELMRHGWVHFVASDGHDTQYRPPVLRDVWQHISRHYGEQRADLLLRTNPQAVLSGERLAATALSRKRTLASWFRQRR